MHGEAPVICHRFSPIPTGDALSFSRSHESERGNVREFATVSVECWACKVSHADLWDTHDQHLTQVYQSKTISSLAGTTVSSIQIAEVSGLTMSEVAYDVGSALCSVANVASLCLDNTGVLTLGYILSVVAGATIFGAFIVGVTKEPAA